MINMLGVIWIVLGGVVAGVGSLVFKLPDAIVMMAVGGALTLADGLWRARSFGAGGWLTDRALGGSLSVLPIWGVGLIVLLINAARLLV